MQQESPKIKIFNAILVSLIILTVIVIFIGVIYAKVKASPKHIEKMLHNGTAISLTPPLNTSETAYYEVGRIRITTEKEDGSEISPVLVISPWLSYPKEDSVFYEEIARKVPAIKGIMQSYFSSKTKNELLQETEEVIEKKLVAEINAQFTLGKISDIYFTDYIFLE
ncbi:MAG: flagellar basal body-associated FliL family protein [Spirochaetales bacterium]|nr:flagellar basal body-associated FliL family protein [Spirochaetales bacterium]